MTLTTTGLRAAADRLIAAAAGPRNATRCVTSWATTTSRRPTRCSACSPNTRWRKDAGSSATRSA